ncbi:helix-turn-helix domain-containing protein [Streptomyces sp. NPDC059853]|uniref:helix-turn-helix domain-containing protein n=1 Tax=Streptomyces sp. NPDC059853 TaxID=3346973 RepID=UPI0036519073
MTDTITTTQAAATARVTVATIRAWCRTGVIAATKTAGRWVIEAASLARRLQIARDRATSRSWPRPSRSATCARGTCGHLATVAWDRIPGARQRPCGKCAAQEALRAERATEDARAAQYGTGPRATQPQLNYLAQLADRIAVLPADCPPRTDWPLLTRSAASHWIDTLKRLATRRTTGRRAFRCECASGRYGGACTC